MIEPAIFQRWLGAHSQPVAVDGVIGPKSRAAILPAFTNLNASAVTTDLENEIALRLGVSLKQLRAVARVESSSTGYDRLGRPKILFERHLFHRLTGGAHSPSMFSDPASGGYSIDSWGKLLRAVSADVEAAFSSCSWGKFQVLGLHWRDLKYGSVLEMAYATVIGEAAHYDMLARFIEKNGLQDEMRALSSDPETCRGFARAYNGPAYARLGYHTKLARAMR